MREPTIYVVASVPALGELGPATEIEKGVLCPVCERQPPWEFPFVEFVFDSWAGEDLVTALGVYVASERLRDAVERAGLTGARFDEVKVSEADHFERGEGAYVADLPRFYRLEFTGAARGPETWWTSDVCEECGLRNWERTDIGREAQIALSFGDPAPPRQVYRSSWSGDDLFRLEDPGPPLVTERVTQVFAGPPVEGVTFQPAEWVSE